MKFDAHIFWAPQIAADWQWQRVAESFKVINGFPFESEHFNVNGVGLPLVRIRDILSTDLPTAYDGTNGLNCVVQNEDIVVGMDGDFNCAWWSKGNSLLNQRVAALRAVPTGKLDPRFAFYQIPYGLKVINDLTPASTVKHLSSYDIAALRLPAPDLPTQKRIAAFLDRETARIDELIAKKERLLSALDAKLRVAITRAVTQGANSEAEMKDSGVDWIGQVPTHWSITKLGYLGRCANGINIGGDAFGSGFPFISYGDVYKNRVLPNTGSGLVQSSVSDRSSYTVRIGDVFFTRTSETIEEVGFSSVCMETIDNAVFAGFLIRFRPSKGKLHPLFSKFAFQHSGLRDYFAKEMNLITRASLSQDLLRNMPVALPPMEEQEIIGQHLEKLEAATRTISDKTRETIEKLKERRAALITAAVTGQINVDTYGKAGTTSATLDRIEEEMQA